MPPRGSVPGQYMTGPGAVGPRGGSPWHPAPPALVATPDTRALLKALGRRWFVALSLGLVCAAGAALAAWFLLSPRYTAFAQVRVEAVPPPVLDGERNGPEGKDTGHLQAPASGG